MHPATPITRVVRKDSSGPAHFLKKYLYQINKATFETEKGAIKNWNEISEGTENTTWPKAIDAVKTSSTGEAAEDELVAKTPGSIGFGNLAEIRNGGLYTPPTGGPNKSTFWAPIQDKSGESIAYADPATNKDVAATAEANCAKTEYTNGETAFPPANVTDPWNEVTTSTVEPKYTLCGLAFVLAFDTYSAFPGTSEGEATTVENFLSRGPELARSRRGQCDRAATRRPGRAARRFSQPADKLSREMLSAGAAIVGQHRPGPGHRAARGDRTTAEATRRGRRRPAADHAASWPCT